MVRFIMLELFVRLIADKLFTFQYGQIYYPLSQNNLLTNTDLHSNMVRFIIIILKDKNIEVE